MSDPRRQQRTLRSASNRAGREQWDPTSRLIQLFPVLTMLQTHAELAATLAVSDLEIVRREQPAVATRDTHAAADAIREELNHFVREIMTWQTRGRAYDQSRYSREIFQVWADAKVAAQWPSNTELGEIDDLAALGRMRAVLERRVSDIRAGQFDAD